MAKDYKYIDIYDNDKISCINNARKLTREYFNTDNLDKAKRRKILEELLAKIGKNVEIDVPFHCNIGKNVYLGDNVIINMNCTFVDDADIRIGSNILIASNVQIYTAYHPTEPEKRLKNDFDEEKEHFFRTCAEPVIIEDNVWIGAGVIILPGVTIGKNSVIGAGSVVNKSIPANCVAVGNPCKPIKYFDNN